MNNTYKGACLCGQVNFEIKGKFERFYLCHCTHCQKGTGSAHAANLFSTTAQLNWLSGQGNIQIFQLPSTRHIKSFCRTCGSAVPSFHTEDSLLVVPAGSLETFCAIRPDAHIFMASRAQWDQGLEQVTMANALPDE